MDLFIAGRYADSLEVFESELRAVAPGCTGHLRCNVAACLFELGLYRKCARECEEILATSDSVANTRAAILFARSLYRINKPSRAAQVAESAVSRVNAFMDAYTVRELSALRHGSDLSDLKTMSIQPIDEPLPSYVPRPRLGPYASSSKDSNINSENNTKLTKFRNKYLGDGPNQISEQLALMAMADVSHSTGDEQIDILIVIGNAQMNFGNMSSAIEIFEGVLEYNDRILAAHLGLGSARALASQLLAADEHFTKAISIDCTVADAWKRRGQTRAASGKLKDALNDFIQAASLTSTDPDIYFQIGVVHYRMNNFQLGKRYIGKSISEGERTPDAYNSLGMCYAQLGDVESSLSAYAESLKLEPRFLDALYNSGIITKEYGDAKKSEFYFRQCIQMNSTYKQAYYSLGVLKYSMGHYDTATRILSQHVALTDRRDVSSLLYLALCLHCMGEYSRAMKEFDNIIALDPSNGIVRTQREVLLYLWRHLNTPFKDINIDDNIECHMKDSWVKKIGWEELAKDIRLEPSKSLSSSEMMTLGEMKDGEVIKESFSLIALRGAAARLGQRIQLRSPGFLANSRQHLMFGMSVLHIAASLRSATSIGNNRLTWRYLSNAAVRWRQISEPNDAVWWIDGFPKTSFDEGFGLETPILQGQLRVIRYFGYFQKTFDIVKTLLLKESNGSQFPENCCFCAGGAPLTTSPMTQVIASASSVEDLWHSVGEDFYVTTKYFSVQDPSLCVEGTRITLLASYPDGFKFTIRTPGTPPRWAIFNEELSTTCRTILVILEDIHQSGPSEANKIKLVKQALIFFYIWVVFAPLSRGSAACGYACLHGILLAGGFLVTSNLPENIQLDWEAILAPSMDIFVENALSMWLDHSTVPVESEVATTDSDGSILCQFSASQPVAVEDLVIDISRRGGDSKERTWGTVLELLSFFENRPLRVMMYLLLTQGEPLQQKSAASTS